MLSEIIQSPSSASGINTDGVSALDSGTFVFERRLAKSSTAVLWNFASCDVDGDESVRFFFRDFPPRLPGQRAIFIPVAFKDLKSSSCVFRRRMRKTQFPLWTRPMLLVKKFFVFFKSSIQSQIFIMWVSRLKAVNLAVLQENVKPSVSIELPRVEQSQSDVSTVHCSLWHHRGLLCTQQRWWRR